MTLKRQIWVLIGVAGAWVAFIVLLNAWHPSVGGVPLREAELARPMSQLLPAEQAHFFEWLGADYVFALVYTVLYTAALRILAAHSRSPSVDLLGRSLSWVTAIAILFDLMENAILWTQASTAATVISPWLPTLVKLKWLSTIIWLTYGLIWIVDRLRGKRGSP